mmetsp:Transcript_6162/g.7986  ORF Transcript_6162/g.7986 Transcript_6162/m.7986 type:complete len:242 (-) Transcript_6162:40-765(-)
MATVEQVRSLNANSGNLIEQGQFKQAASVLSRAIAKLTASALTLQQSTDANANANANITASVASATPNITLHANSTQEQIDPTKSEFFHQPFFFQEVSTYDVTTSTLLEQPFTPEKHTACSVCCLFNLGLCFHLEWMKHNKTKACLLVKAARFYEQALSLVSGSYVASLQPTDAFLKVLMPICANATHCHIQLGNRSQATYFNQRLVQILEFSGDCHPQSSQMFSFNAFFNSFPRNTADIA